LLQNALYNLNGARQIVLEHFALSLALKILRPRQEPET
jgi:hypothetical protein